MSDITLKTGVNTRAPLASRLPKKASPPPPAGLNTTYKEAYQRAEGGPVNGAEAHRGNASRSGRNSARRGEGEADKTDADVVSYPSNKWESETHGQGRRVQPDQATNFYSSVRIAEKEDDDLRGSHAGRTQRAVEVRNKRAENPDMCPPRAEYAPQEGVQAALLASQEKGLVRRNYLDLVECAHRNPDTEQQIGFDDQPQGRLPGLDLSQDAHTQSKAMTHMGTSKEMFSGTAKNLEDRPVGYAGHVPRNPKNLEQIHENDERRQYSKSYMTLAVHGGGVDASIVENSLKAQRRSGNNAPAATSLKPKSEESVARTTEGRMLQAPFNQTVEGEKKMNVRDDAQGKNYF